MTNKYVLEIDCVNSDIDKLIKILDIKIDNTFKWEYVFNDRNKVFSFEIIEYNNDKYFDYINYFLNCLENKYISLNNIGIKKENITIWRYYRYDNQCNIELNPQETYRLGKDGISLCISCIDISGNEYINIGNKKVKKDDWI